MRTVNDQPNGQRDGGAILVWVALMLVVLVGIGALVIDVGRLYVERRELQNGADAAALAIAQDCAGGNCGNEAATAQEFADLNSKDDAGSAVETGTPCGNHPDLDTCNPVDAPDGIGGANWVRVGTSTLTSEGDEVSFLLAPIISALTGKTVRASATAAWGTLQAGVTIPFTFSECEFNLLPVDPETGFPPTDLEIFVYSKDDGPKKNPLPECESRTPSGGTVNGGFGWLAPNDGPCRVKISVGETMTASGDQGNDSELKGCESLIQGKEVLVPLFSAATDPPNSTYTIAGFMGFIVTGYQLSGQSYPSKQDFACPPLPGTTGQGGNLRCFRGTFTQYYATQGEFGGSDLVDFGARVIKMVE
jgi:hypothetical protein